MEEWKVIDDKDKKEAEEFRQRMEYTKEDVESLVVVNPQDHPKAKDKKAGDKRQKR